MKQTLPVVLPVILAVLCAAPALAGGPSSDAWWWPTLKAPRAVVRTIPVNQFEDPPMGDGAGDPSLGPTHMMVESASGLAAAAVDRGEFDAMVWITTDNPNQRLAYRLLQQRLKLEDRGEVGPWELIRRLKDAGVVKGYVLYRYERSSRGPHQGGGFDASVNAATSVAGLLGAVIVDESLEARTRELGLDRLLDVRGKDAAWVFEHYRDRLNRRLVMFQDPKIPHARDYAVAHRAMVLYGHDDPVRRVLAWLEPLSPVLGWNRGDEGGNAKLFSQYGHFNTATDWAMNLTLLSAGAAEVDPPKLPQARPLAADRRDDPAVAFVMSDGDNLQWMVQNFFVAGGQRYWDNPHHGQFPMTWTLCLAHMRQVTPDLLRYVVESMPESASAVEFGGGYYFPDHFGELRDEPDLLARQARRTWAQMRAVGADTLCLIFSDLDSDAAKAAFRVYAREMPGLRGILAMQYYPYHAGEGQVFWVPRDDGPPMPVVTCRFELRTDFDLPGTGGVDKIARRLNTDPMPSQWVVVHAWSSFPNPDGQGKVTGLSPVGWAIDRLEPPLHAVTAQQMFMRLTPPDDPAVR